ncbi:hypothetical protein GCM10022243_37750 [Saccharothrix violaceirubra]
MSVWSSTATATEPGPMTGIVWQETIDAWHRGGLHRIGAPGTLGGNRLSARVRARRT